MVMNKVVDELTQYCINEFKKEENITKIKVFVIDPLIEYTFKKLYPYILITSIIFFLTFILAIVILFMIIKSNN
tara:strand:+ start:810 stop:1031 length:222 start_codon:yes stop_codon:yes gene_type:complete